MYIQTLDISNVAIDEATFPACRPEVFLGDSSNQPVEDVGLPGVLEGLPLLDFNQCVRNALRSAGLKAWFYVTYIYQAVVRCGGAGLRWLLQNVSVKPLS